MALSGTLALSSTGPSSGLDLLQTLSCIGLPSKSAARKHELTKREVRAAGCNAALRDIEPLASEADRTHDSDHRFVLKHITC